MLHRGALEADSGVARSDQGLDWRTSTANLSTLASDRIRDCLAARLGRAAFVPVMEPADLGQLQYVAQRGPFDGSWLRRVLA